MRFRVVAAEAWRSMTASLSTTAAATMTVLIGMFLVGLLIALGTWAMAWSDHQKKKLLVEVFLCTDTTCGREVTPKQTEALRVKLESDSRVRSVEYVSKDEAYNIMQQKAPELLEQLAANPFPASFKVQPVKGEYTKAIADSLSGAQKPAGVEKVKYGKKTAERVLQVARVFTVLSILGIAVLLIAATILIGNTIRLSIFARRREIEVMKLVGASNWFVRGPFVLEGMLCALAGSIAAVILLFLGKELVLPAILHEGDRTDSQVHALAFFWNAAILIAVGLTLGAAGSGLTLRRFLHV
jgi:cell division transport system permease protein